MVDWKVFAIGGIAIIAILLVLFYLSPFSEINIIQCEHQRNVPNPAGAQLQPICGYLVLPDATVPFPFRARSTDYANFCKRNLPAIEASCNTKVDSALLESIGGEEYACVYFVHNSTDVMELKRYLQPPTEEEVADYRLNMIYLKPYPASFSASFDYKTSCNNLTGRFS
jgi:hypothetical protein